MSEIKLPTEPTISEDQNPTVLAIISKPKIGKTSLLAGLPNCLILDFEKGSKFVKAMKVNIESIDDLSNLANLINEAGFPYDYIGVDTLSSLEDLCESYAEVLYSRTPMGKYWFTAKNAGEKSGKERYGGILSLPEGGGYYFLRLSFQKVLELIKKLAPRVILMGHIKDVFLEKDDTKVASVEIDMSGKLKKIVAKESDVIGYLHRKKNQNILSFKTTDDVICGARAEHISNQEIIVSEKINGKIYTYWDKIFLDLPEKEQPRAPEEK